MRTSVILMVAAPRKNFKPRAQTPFAAVLALEFGRTKGHIHRVITGERTSPLRQRILDRQAELLRNAAQKEPAAIASKPIEINSYET